MTQQLVWLGSKGKVEKRMSQKTVQSVLLDNLGQSQRQYDYYIWYILIILFI